LQSEAAPFERNLVEVFDLKKYFLIRAGLAKRQVGAVKAVDEVTFFIKRGETLGLVGESGCGKTTVGRALMLLTPPTGGYVFFETPKVVVKDFQEVVKLRQAVKRTVATPGEVIKLVDTIDRMLGAQACEVRKDKKEPLCKVADKLRREVSKLPPNAKLGRKREDALHLTEEALEEVAKRYCINYKTKREVQRLRNRMQFVFQDPFSSLNPKMLIKDIVAEPLYGQKRYAKRLIRHLREAERKAKTNPTTNNMVSLARLKQQASVLPLMDWRKEPLQRHVVDLLEKVGLNVEHMYRYPHEFSGGQRQRIGIARALSVRPEFVVLDEPTSALDVSVQAQILNMLNTLQNNFGLTYLFISHDLSTIKYMCDRVAVMYLGKIAEYAKKQDLYSKPVHPYTEALLSVIPVPDPELKRDRIILPGDVPSPANPPPGCRFHTRCPVAIDICRVVEPPLIDIGNEHYVACHVRAPVPEVIEDYRRGKTTEDVRAPKRP